MLLDTSTVVEIFRNPGESSVLEKITSNIGDEEVYLSIIQIAEVADWAARNRATPEDRVSALKELARIVPLDESICVNAAEIKRQRRKEGYGSFGLIDGIILATARSIGQKVLTFDKDFDGEDDCVVISGRT